MSEPDYRPFLRDGDLVTAEDVFQWLGTIDDDHDIVPIRKRSDQEPRTIAEWCRSLKPARMTVEDAIPLLRERLDRERRRALRRGAKHHWTWFSCGLREYERRVNQEGLISDSDALESLEIDLSRALAFRAAARAK